MKTIFFVIFATFIALSFADEIYYVIKNDNLSSIIKKKLPEQKIYGKNGFLNKIQKLNPQIRNPNIIYPNTKLTLPDFSYPKAAAQTPIAQKTLIEIENKNLPIMASWSFKFLYGLDYTQIQQSKTFTAISFNSTVNTYKIETEFKNDTYKIAGSYESKPFSFTKSNIVHKAALKKIELFGSFENYVFGVSSKDRPIIKATSTALDLINETEVGPLIGYEKNGIINIIRPININSRSYITIPLIAYSDRDDVSLKSIKGFEVGSILEFNSNILKRENYKIDFLWQNEVNYTNTSRNINLGSSSGSLKSSGVNLKSMVGISYNF